MKVVGIIPSRYDSKRFPGKAMYPIHGKPLIQHVYERAKKLPLDSLFITTDSMRIAGSVEFFGAPVIMTGKNRTGTDRVGEAADKLQLRPEDIVINIQGDQPIFPIHYTEDLIVGLDSFDITTLSCVLFNRTMIESHNVVKVQTELNSGGVKAFSRSPLKQFFGCNRYWYSKHIGIYCYTKRFLDIFRGLPTGVEEKKADLEQLRALENGYKIKAINATSDSFSVDSVSDIATVETYMKLSL